MTSRLPRSGGLPSPGGRPTPPFHRLALLAALLLSASPALAQSNGGWSHWGADAASTRYAPFEQINAGNFGELEVAWRWFAGNYGPVPDYVYRGTPIYANGTLYALAGSRRAVVAIEPTTGETLWVWRMPDNPRWAASPRQNYGKSVIYEEVDGRGVILMTTPGFFLVALDAETGIPIEGWGQDGTGIVDMLAYMGVAYDPWLGPDEGKITTSSAPIVVNGMIVVPNTGEQGYYQFMKTDVPNHILGFDLASGEFQWRFNVIPRPGEFGHDTWEGDSWEYTGNVGSWAPISADLERGIVYLVTKAGTNDYYGGHRLGDGLFGTSLIALDAATGERIWHFQLVRHDVWNYDTSHAPQLVDITVNGEEIPAVAVVTKQAFTYVFNRVTGEPVWPFEYRDVPQSDVPGEQLSPVQPFPTRPAPFEMQGITEDDLIDFTPELRTQALEIVANYRMGPLFNPPSVRSAPDGTIASIHCPGANGGANIPGGASIDPETGILYVASTRGCSAPQLIPGTDVDPDSDMRYVTRGPGGVSGPQGLPLFKPPWGTITAIDLNTGDHLWQIPNGDTPASVRNHEALAGVELGNTGQRAHATVLSTRSLLIYGEGRGGEPNLRAVNKLTGEEVGRIEIPAPPTTAPMTFMHEGKQYIVLPIARSGYPAELVALTLPDTE